MGRVTATSTMDVHAPAAAVAEAVADYAQVRPRILPEQYSAYRVLEGGQGTGTRAAWNLRATKKRNRDVDATVTVSGTPDTHIEIVEEDANSTMVTTYVVRSTAGGSLVEMTTSWDGAKGIGGFFERTFAPGGLKKIQHELLENLRVDVEGSAGRA